MMGCWIDFDNPCGKCFGCYNVVPDLVPTKLKLLNGTFLTSCNVFTYQDEYL